MDGESIYVHYTPMVTWIVFCVLLCFSTQRPSAMKCITSDDFDNFTNYVYFISLVFSTIYRIKLYLSGTSSYISLSFQYFNLIGIYRKKQKPVEPERDQVVRHSTVFQCCLVLTIVNVCGVNAATVNVSCTKTSWSFGSVKFMWYG